MTSPTEAPRTAADTYEAWVQRVAAALHEDCILEWKAILVVDPKRELTQHATDTHYGKAHNLVRRLGLAEAAVPAEAGHRWNGVEGHDCVDCPPVSIWKCDIRAHGGPRTDEHGRLLSTPAEQLRWAAEEANRLVAAPLTDEAESSAAAPAPLDVERLRLYLHDHLCDPRASHDESLGRCSALAAAYAEGEPTE